MTTLKTILISGFIATTSMTILMLSAPMMSMPKMLIGNMLANFFGIAVLWGWIAHFVIGTLIATNYVVLFSKRFQIPVIFRGMLFSFIPYLVSQLVVMPIIGAGLFFSNTNEPMMMSIGSLIGHLAYGAVLGFIEAKIRIL